MMIKVVIIDDESLARKLVTSYLKDHPDFQVLAECSDGFEGMKGIQLHQPDLVFLDIQMPKLNGFELLELLDPAPEIIFTTAFDEYAIKAFDLAAVDYLLKPFDKNRFAKALDKARERLAKKEQNNSTEKLISNIRANADEIERIAVKSGNEIRIIPLTQIRYIEAYDDYVKIFTEKDMYLKKQTISYYEQTLPSNQFIRIHRSVLLNLKDLHRIEHAEKENYWVILRDQTKLSVSKSGHRKLKLVLNI